MSETFTRATLVLILILASTVPASRAYAEGAREIVVRADRVRNPERPFRVISTLTEYKAGNPVDHSVFAVYSKLDPSTGQFRDLMLYVEPPRDYGKVLLLNGSNLWLYDPTSRASIRFSPQEKLAGEATAGDVLTENLTADYTASLQGVETITDANRKLRSCWHLELKAATDAATYSRIEYWVERESYFPVKAKFFADSGGLLKVLYYRNYVHYGDRIGPSQAVIVDAVDPALVTTVDFGEPHFQDIPDSWFEREYLPHLKLGR